MIKTIPIRVKLRQLGILLVLIIWQIPRLILSHFYQRYTAYLFARFRHEGEGEGKVQALEILWNSKFIIKFNTAWFIFAFYTQTALLSLWTVRWKWPLGRRLKKNWWTFLICTSCRRDKSRIVVVIITTIINILTFEKALEAARLEAAEKSQATSFSNPMFNQVHT